MSRDERGFASAQMIVLLVASFALLAWLTNVLFIQFERASARSALADAARQAARTQANSPTCEQTIADVLNRLVPGAMTPKSQVFTNPTCVGVGDPNSPVVTAKMHFNFDPWFPGVPNADGDLTVTVQKRNGSTP